IGTAENAEPWMREARKRKERFMGFGHRVYRTYDPRAKILKAMCERLNPTFYALASKVEETALAILHEEHPERPQATNVEFYSAGVLQAIGLPKAFFPPTFAVSRAAGWTAHVLEQVANNEEGPHGRRRSGEDLRPRLERLILRPIDNSVLRNLGLAALAWFLLIAAAITAWWVFTPIRQDALDNDLTLVYIGARIGLD